MDKNKHLVKRPFTYRATKDGKVIIYRDNKQVRIIKGKAAQQFTDLASHADARDIQLALARLTGHYKQGNES